MKSLIVIIACFTLSINCKQKSADNTATEKKDDVSQIAEAGTRNAGKAKPPKGKLSCTIDGTSFVANETTVQCMFVGLGKPDFAQGIISSSANGTQITASFMGKPAVGVFKGSKISDPIGLSITNDGVQYNSALGGKVTIDVIKIKAEGSNFYIGGTFTGTLKSTNGNIINVTDGIFESAYL
jgi:hypothetical protein